LIFKNKTLEINMKLKILKMMN